MKSVKEYSRAFDEAYPLGSLTRHTVAKAIAAFEYTIVSRESTFDKWISGDQNAMTASQINGFRLFRDVHEITSIPTLLSTVNYYNDVDLEKEKLSANLTDIDLTQKETHDVVAFIEALSTKMEPLTPPILPMKEQYL